MYINGCFAAVGCGPGDTLAIPLYCTGASVLTLTLHIALSSPQVRRIHARALQLCYPFVQNQQIRVIELDSENSEATQVKGLLAIIMRHISSRGGFYVFAFKIATFMGCLGLLSLSMMVYRWVPDENRKLDAAICLICFVGGYYSGCAALSQFIH